MKILTNIVNNMQHENNNSHLFIIGVLMFEQFP